MMLPEAAIIRHVQCMVDPMMAEQNRQGRTVSRDAIEDTIARALSRMSSQEEASYLTEHGLKLFSTKGMEYHECTDRFVIVTYEEQDGEGFFTAAIATAAAGAGAPTLSGGSAMAATP